VFDATLTVVAAPTELDDCEVRAAEIAGWLDRVEADSASASSERLRSRGIISDCTSRPTWVWEEIDTFASTEDAWLELESSRFSAQMPLDPLGRDLELLEGSAEAWNTVELTGSWPEADVVTQARLYGKQPGITWELIASLSVDGENSPGDGGAPTTGHDLAVDREFGTSSSYEQIAVEVRLEPTSEDCPVASCQFTRVTVARLWPPD